MIAREQYNHIIETIEDLVSSHSKDYREESLDLLQISKDTSLSGECQSRNEKVKAT